MRGRWWISAWIAAIVLHAVLFWLGSSPRPRRLVGDEHAYAAQAKLLQAGTPASPDLLHPPLYSRFLAFTRSLGQGGRNSTIAVQIALLVAAALLSRSALRHLGATPLIADLVALAMLNYPPLAAYAHYFWPEALHMALLSAILWILAAKRGSPAWCATLGALLGLALLTKSLLLGFAPVLLAPLALEGRIRALRTGAALAATILIVLPTVLVHQRRAGTATIANSATFNLWVGLNDRSRRSYVDPIVGEEHRAYMASSPEHVERVTIYRQKIGALVAEKGLRAVIADQLGKQYFRLFDKNSILTDQLPGGVRSSRRAGYQGKQRGIATVLRGTSFVLYGVVLAGAALGLAWSSSSRPRWLWIPLLFLVYNLAIFLFLHVKARYRIPMMPFLFLYAALALDTVRRVAAGDAAAPAAWRSVLGAAGALVLLGLAFGGGYL